MTQGTQNGCSVKTKRDGRRVQEEGGIVYPWSIHVDVWQKPSQYCNYPTIKNKI